MYLRVNHASRSLRSHMLSRLDNSGTKQEEVARSITDNHECPAPACSSCFRNRLEKHFNHFIDFFRQLIKARVICRRKCTNDDVPCLCYSKDLQAYKLTKSATQSIPFHDCMTMFSNNYRRSCIRKQGVVGPNVEMFGTQSSPCSLHLLQI